MSVFWIIVIVVAVICYVDHVEKRMKRLNRDHENLVNRLRHEAEDAAIAQRYRDSVTIRKPIDMSGKPEWFRKAFGGTHD